MSNRKREIFSNMENLKVIRPIMFDETEESFDEDSYVELSNETNGVPISKYDLSGITNIVLVEGYDENGESPIVDGIQSDVFLMSYDGEFDEYELSDFFYDYDVITNITVNVDDDDAYYGNACVYISYDGFYELYLYNENEHIVDSIKYENVVDGGALVYYKDASAFDKENKLCYVSDSNMENYANYSDEEMIKYGFGHSRESLRNKIDANFDFDEDIKEKMLEDLFDSLAGFDVDSYITIIDPMKYFVGRK